MSEQEARAMLEGLAQYGDDRARAIAAAVLGKWDAVTDAARRMRESRARKAPQPNARSDVPDATLLRSVTEQNATTGVTEHNGNATGAPKTPSLLSDLKNLGRSERGSGTFEIAEPVALRSGKVKHRYPETVAPNPDDRLAFVAFCADWKLDAADHVTVACIGHHYAKGTKWRDWGWAVRNWKKRERPAGNGAWVQPVPQTGRVWKAGDGA